MYVKFQSISSLLSYSTIIYNHFKIYLPINGQFSQKSSLSNQSQGRSPLELMQNPSYRAMYEQMLQNPQYRQMLTDMMSNPQMMQMMMQSMPGMQNLAGGMDVSQLVRLFILVSVILLN